MTISSTQFKTFVSQLSPKKKAELLQIISRDLGESFPGIEKTPNVCGGSACIIRTRIPIWTLVTFKKAKISEQNLLDSYPNLRRQDLNNAWAYYQSNKKEIDLDIKENSEH